MSDPTANLILLPDPFGSDETPQIVRSIVPRLWSVKCGDTYLDCRTETKAEAASLWNTRTAKYKAPRQREPGDHLHEGEKQMIADLLSRRKGSGQ